MGGVLMSSMAEPSLEVYSSDSGCSRWPWPTSATMSSTVIRSTSGLGIWDCRQIQCLWAVASVSVLTDGEGWKLNPHRQESGALVWLAQGAVGNPAGLWSP